MLAARRADLLAAQDALAAVGVPAVLNAGGSVFKTAAATQWLTLLEALEQPHRADRVRAAALTDFFGRTAEDLQAEPDPTDELSEHVRRLADVFAARGVAAVLESAVLDGLIARVLGRVGGERTLTDLRHVGEALHKVAVSERFGVVGLLGWLRTQVADDKIEVASERTRRLDSDAAAVQLVTIHGSKGLEYPVVYLPTLWDRWVRDDGRPPLPRRPTASAAATWEDRAGGATPLSPRAATRTPASRSDCSTSPSPGRSRRWSRGTARPPTTPPPRRSTACCSGVPRGTPASTTSSRSSVTTSSSTSSAAGSRPAGRSPRWPRSCRSTPHPSSATCRPWRCAPSTATSTPTGAAPPTPPSPPPAHPMPARPTGCCPSPTTHPTSTTPTSSRSTTRPRPSPTSS